MTTISLKRLVNELFGITLYDYQQKFLYACLNKPRVLGCFARQCLDGNTQIPLYSGGYKYLKNILEGDEVFSYNDGVIEKDIVKACWVSGERQTYKIKTYQNEEIICSAKHPFMTKYYSHGILKKGWRSIESGINHNMWIASPNGFNGGYKKLLSDDLCFLLGYLIADGNYKSSVKFTNTNKNYLKEVEDIATRNFKDIIPKRYKKGNGEDLLLTAKPNGGVKNSLAKFLLDIGIFGQVGSEKIIPEIILKTSNANKFLNRFFSGDGWVSENEVGVCCTSKEMVAQIRHLLERYGCKPYLTEEKGRKLQKSEFWKLRITDRYSLINFFNNVGLIYGKEKKSELLIKRINLPTKGFLQGKIWKDIRWLRIKTIEKLDIRTTYDLETEKNHNFIANNLVVHNTGKSMTIAIATAMSALRKPNGHIVLVAPTDRQAGELFIKITNFLQESKIKSEVKTITQRSATMNNGCRITALPCGDDGSNIRGMTADLLIIEEAAFIKNQIMADVLMPMVAATHGNIVKISTPFGMNHFYKSYQSDEWDIHHIDYHEAIRVGHYSEEFINEQKNQYGVSSIGFRTEYGAEFIADQDNYFGYDLIEKCISEYPLLFQPSEGKQYYLGADIARFGNDSTVLTVVEKGSELLPHKVVQIKELHGLPIDEVIEAIYTLHQTFHFIKIYIDETGLGAGVTDVLRRRLGERNKTKFTTSAKQYDFQDIVVGVTFTIKNKIDIFSNLRVLMEQGRLIFPNNKKLIYQLKDFRYERTESGNLKLHHSEGGFDDYVDSCALAVRGINVQDYILDW